MKLDLIIWNEMDYLEYLSYLKSLQDMKYLHFTKNLVTSKYEILGIRVPILRGIAKEILKGDYTSFLKYVKHVYIEEIMVEGFVIASIAKEEEFDKYFLKYIDYIDNWSVNDSFCNSLSIMKNNPKKYFNVCMHLSLKNDCYHIRVGLISILYNFVDDKHIDDIFNILDNLKIDTYYVNMAGAWLLCECMIKYSKETLKYLKVTKVNSDLYKKALQKMRDSYRISDELKLELKKIY